MTGNGDGSTKLEEEDTGAGNEADEVGKEV